MMRMNIKLALFCLCIAVFLITLSFWTRCGDYSKEWKRHFDGIDKTVDNQGSEEIDCVINGDYTVACRKEGDEVYLPFSFLHKYFEVYGKLASYDGSQRFEWSHSYSKIYHPKGKYDPRGVFMHFENYNVEIRERVKCVSAIEGVPVSTQWGSQGEELINFFVCVFYLLFILGYYYPTQIAQFGLSHYSKNLTEPEPRRKLIDDSDKELGKWILSSGAIITRYFDKFLNNKILNFTTLDFYESTVTLKMDHVLDFVMNLNIILCANSSFTIVLQNREKKDIYNLHYIASDILISAQVCMCV